MVDVGPLNFVPFEEPDEPRQSQEEEEYEAQQRDSHCQHKPLESNHEREVRVLLLSIDEGYIELVCPGCRKPPLWMDDFRDGVIMKDIVVRSVLTSDRGHYPDYEPDGPWIELTIEEVNGRTSEEADS